jgi:hypothetical protein
MFRRNAAASIPKEVPEGSRLKVTIKLDTGPFGGIIEGTKEVTVRK